MEDKENRPKQMTSCMSKGPGPAYKLPGLVGYIGHDPSRYRNPAYSIPGRLGLRDAETASPGPAYDISKLTKSGVDNPPAYTIKGREEFKAIGFGPGPGAYHPENVPPMNHYPRPPAYTIKSRSMIKLTGDGPGPNAYILPPCLGPNIPHKTAKGAFTISGRHESSEQSNLPGPADYYGGNLDAIKKRYPAYSLKSRTRIFGVPEGPGPIYYPEFNAGKRPPMYSFGMRHSECAAPAITDLDD